jgi:hypothetical protein
LSKSRTALLESRTVNEKILSSCAAKIHKYLYKTDS